MPRRIHRTFSTRKGSLERNQPLFGWCASSRLVSGTILRLYVLFDIMDGCDLMDMLASSGASRSDTR